MDNTFQDKELTCRDCGKTFVWTAGEQEFYAQKGFQNAPIRCSDCRRARKNDRQSTGGGSNGTREMYTIVCSDCGKEGQVPFKPRNPDAPVRCADCFRNHRGMTTPAGMPAASSDDNHAHADTNGDDDMAA